MERNISHLESKNKNWQKRTRLLAAKLADHNWITETSYIRYKITTIQREEKKTTTLAFSAVVRRSDMRESIGCTAISGHQLKHSTNNATTLGCVHSAAT